MDMCDECFIYDYLCVCVRFACGRSLVRFQYSQAQKFALAPKNRPNIFASRAGGDAQEEYWAVYSLIGPSIFLRQ